MECSSPVRVFSESGDPFYVRCGRCYECLQYRSSAWISRLLFERENWTNTYFFTLTYNDDNLPRNSQGRSQVSKSDIQTFIADLRKRFQQGFFNFDGFRFSLPPKLFRYYITSEYGSIDKTFRPHYHGVLYIDYDDTDTLLLLFTHCWHRGFVDFQPAGEKAVGYVSKYLVKYGLDLPELYIQDEEGNLIFSPIERPFSLMSKHLGACYLTPKKLDWHRQSPVERGYIPGHMGKKSVLPRYFRDMIFDDDMKAQRLESFLSEEALRLELENEKTVEQIKEEISAEDFLHRERVRQARRHYKKLKKL